MNNLRSQYIRYFDKRNLIKYLIDEGYTAEADILKMHDVDGIKFLVLTEQDLLQWDLNARQRKSILNCRNKVLAEGSHQTSETGGNPTLPNELPQPNQVGLNSTLRIAKELENKLRLGNSLGSGTNFRQNQEISRKSFRPILAKSQIDDLDIKDNATGCNLYIDMTKNLPSFSVDKLDQTKLGRKLLPSISINSKESLSPNLSKNELSSSKPYLFNNRDDNVNTNNNDDTYLIPDCGIDTIAVRVNTNNNDDIYSIPDYGIDTSEPERIYSKPSSSLPVLTQDLDVNIPWKEASLNPSHTELSDVDSNSMNLMSSKLPLVEARPPELPPKRKCDTSSKGSSENIYELEPVLSKIAHPSLPPQAYDNHRLQRFQPPRPIQDESISGFNADSLGEPKGKWKSAIQPTQQNGSLNKHFEKKWHPPIPPRPNAILNADIPKKSSAKYAHQKEPSRSQEQITWPVLRPQGSVDHLEKAIDNIYELDPLDPNIVEHISVTQRKTDNWLPNCTPPSFQGSLLKPEAKPEGKWGCTTQTAQQRGSVNDHLKKKLHPQIPPRPNAIPNAGIPKDSSAKCAYEEEPSRSLVQEEARTNLRRQGSVGHLEGHINNIYELDPLESNIVEPTSLTYSYIDPLLLNYTLPSPRGPLHKPEAKAWNMSRLPKPPPFKNKLEPDQLAIIQDLRVESYHETTYKKEFNPNDFRYYRNTDRTGAKQLLMQIPNLGDGAFLFRTSGRYSLGLTIFFQDYVYNVGVQINPDDGTFYCNTDNDKLVVTFKTLEEFVEYYKTNPLTVKREGVHLEIYLRELLPDNVY